MQWNFSLEQALGASQTLKVMYVGSAGRRLLFTDFLFPPTNPNFSSGQGLQLTTGRASSNYHALQLELQKRLSHGLQALASYTWSHSIDDSSSNLSSDNFTDLLLRASSDFDVRHNFQAALTCDIPGSYSSRFVSGLLRHWGLDTRISARSPFPLDIPLLFGRELLRHRLLDFLSVMTVTLRRVQQSVSVLVSATPIGCTPEISKLCRLPQKINSSEPCTPREPVTL
jgi:hypothetical protein